MEIFWKVVKNLNWDGDYERCTKYLIDNYSKEDISKLENVFNNLFKDLDSRFHDDWLEDIPVGDDGWSDLRSEVIGRGKEFFENITVEKLIEMGEKEDYKESFGYIFPYNYEDTVAEIKAKSLPTVVEESERTLLDKVESIIMNTKGHIDREHTVASIKAAIKLEFKKLK